ncbi:MAG: hypothetical protein WDN72_04895 [Alphaproteobacteria bacterium]
MSAAEAALHALFHHRLLEALLRFEQSRHVEEDELRPSLRQHAGDARARRLRLGGDDGDLGAQQRVEQRRFARVGGSE